MRLYKVVVLVNVAVALGLLAGYLWWAGDVERLRRELDTARRSAPALASGTSWTVAGIVRAVLPKDQTVVITHEPLEGLMGSMTMPFRVGDPALARGLAPGDRVRFTLVASDKELLVVALRKEGTP